MDAINTKDIKGWLSFYQPAASTTIDLAGDNSYTHTLAIHKSKIRFLYQNNAWWMPLEDLEEMIGDGGSAPNAAEKWLMEVLSEQISKYGKDVEIVNLKSPDDNSFDTKRCVKVDVSGRTLPDFLAASDVVSKWFVN